MLAFLALYLWVESAYFPDEDFNMGLSSLLDDASKALRQQQQQQEEEEGSSLSQQEQLERENIPRVSPPQQSTPVRIAYAISITHCNLKKSLDYIKVTDGPAVLAHSIHLNSVQHAESKSKYDYQLYAFVHPEATNCSTYLSDYNYTVKVLDTPFDVSMIKKEIYKERIQREEAGCCKEKEFLKLYSYTLQQHPIVVHLDADCLILKPLDNLFDAMLLPDEEEKHLGTNIVQWPKDQMVKRRIHSFFTRDYPMGNPTMKVEHFGVQGGFWIVRPNLTAFEEFKHLIIEGNFSSGWYDADTKYPGFYGAAMIQGLVGFFYGHIHPNQAVELNRCSFNNMAEDSWDLKKARCKIPHNPNCTSCRQAKISDIYSTHFTFCQKPWTCSRHNPQGLNTSLCYQFMESWFQTRYHLETSGWGLPGPDLDQLSDTDKHFYGYCPGRRYTPLKFVRNATISRG